MRPERLGKFKNSPHRESNPPLSGLLPRQKNKLEELYIFWDTKIVKKKKKKK
jgi:hypothetical protein